MGQGKRKYGPELFLLDQQLFYYVSTGTIR